MKKYIITAALIVAVCGSATADVAPKNAYKAMLTVYAYDAQGKLLHSGPALIVDNQGSSVTAYTTLEGASRADVVDASGKKHAVHRILGANSTTDLVKFSIDGMQGASYFAITQAPATKGTALQLIKYGTDRKQQVQNVSISSDEAYNDYRYYHITATNDAANMVAPLIDAQGNLVAIVQRNVAKDAQTACAIDARFANDLTITATSSLNSDLHALNIPKALPSNVKDATTYIYMLPQADSVACTAAYNDFIATWPNLPDGYVNRGTWYANHGNYASCEADFATAFDKATRDTTSLKVDAVHHSLSNLIYHTIIQRNDSVAPYSGWTLARAEQEADKAYEIAPYTLYLVQKGNCQYAQRNYSGAAATFQRACEDEAFSSPETYFSAARSLEMAGGDNQRVMALLDSCIAHIEQPASAENAQYYLERSQRYLQAKQYRKAVLDYNEYEKAIGPKNLTAQFYYLREQAELEARMYQQALDDIRTAIATSDEPLMYRLEECVVLLRVGEFEQALDAANKLQADMPDSPDCYKILGIAHGELGHKAQARQYLEKAQQLGDTTVSSFIKKYQ